ncbi:MAG: hypothetical protein AAGK32_00770, partial [Actinomycetota bacterium]
RHGGHQRHVVVDDEHGGAEPVPQLTHERDERFSLTLGDAVLIIDHDMPLVTAVSDRMIAMDTGRVVAEGSPGDVVADPAVVESYLGTDEAAIARSGSR